MAKILVHAMAATAGGGVTYLRQLLTHAADHSSGHQWVVLLPPKAPVHLPQAEHLHYHVPRAQGGALGRLWFDQASLRRWLERESIDLLLATANFGMIAPPVPQILLNRNALYFCPDHLRELRARHDYRTLVTTLARRQMAIASIRSSQINVAPTRAFADQMTESTGLHAHWEILPFGFDHEGYARHRSDLAKTRMADRLARTPGVRRVLLVSHYNYFRNFDTLLRAMAILHRQRQEQRLGPVELILTTRLARGGRFHRYDTTSSANLLHQLGIEEITTMLGSVSTEELPSLYDLADVVVCPSYAESFGHPMVEAMACGRPLVAADRPVHREICGPAALYFSTFDPEQLAYRLGQILDDAELAGSLADQGRQRAQRFQWSDHFGRLTQLIEQTIEQTSRTLTHA
jgi:glycosyltransferase involved in cell wall biosynthesis